MTATPSGTHTRPAAPATGPRVCDYEGSPYRRVFWEDADRSYEDEADRLAIQQLLPDRPGRLLEIGAGYGRLAGLYTGASETILLDYAQSMLADAAANVPPGVRLVCADLYHLPFADRSIDTVVQVRVLHHVEDVPAAILEVARVLRTGGSYVLEFANKRNAKAVGRWLAGAQDEDPFDLRPHEFVDLNWNFHPGYVEAALKAAGLSPRSQLAASMFRLPLLKKWVPARKLAKLDRLVGGQLGALAPGPSQYLRAARLTGGADQALLWRCPACGNQPLEEVEGGVPCARCGRFWPREEGVYLMRVPFAR